MEDLGEILKRLAAKATTKGFQESPGQDSLDDLTDCEICSGRGWFTPNVRVGHAEFGHTIMCQCREENLKEERRSRLLRYSNLGSLTRFTFESLRPEGISDDSESRSLFSKAYHAAIDYAAQPTGWLVFMGPHGVGKTHLAAAIANRAIVNGYVVFFVHAPELLDHLRESFNPATETSYSDLFDQVKNTPILIIDDLGSHSSTAWAQEKLQQLVNHRYNAELPTVITTLVGLEEVDPYLRARLETEGLSTILRLGNPQATVSLSLGGIESEMAHRMTFEAYNPNGNNLTSRQQASLETAFQAARNFAEYPDGWLTLFGETGVGKTHLAVAIVNERKSKGQDVFFAFVPELMDYLRYAFSPDSKIPYDRLFDQVKNSSMLVLDDLGQEHSTPWAAEKLYQIMVHRHNARLPTVITTSEDFTHPTGPISSRIQDPSVGLLIKVDSPDYRNKNRIGQRRKVAKRSKKPG